MTRPTTILPPRHEQCARATRGPVMALTAIALRDSERRMLAAEPTEASEAATVPPPRMRRAS